MIRIATTLLATVGIIALTAATLPSMPPVICKAYLPNAFSPNDDGINDTFEPSFGECKPVSYEMKIFNRWGKMVFSTESFEEGWNGKINDKEAASDLYAYYIKLSYQTEDVGTETQIISGEVSLLR